MKSNNENKKLEFKKETIAKLGEGTMSGVYGGTNGEHHTFTKNVTSCVCQTHATIKDPCGI